MLTNLAQAVAEVVLDVLIVAGAWVIMSVPAVLEARDVGSCQAPVEASAPAP